MSGRSPADRREAVLDSAMETFARFGYRKTSMDQVAVAAQISRPGLYFLFDSKEALFRAAVTQVLEQDLAAAQSLLEDSARPLPERLLLAFDQWAGRYVGPLAHDISGVINENPALLGEIVATAPRRFAELITGALRAQSQPQLADRIAQTLISTSIGIKAQAGSRQEYLDRMQVAVDLLAAVQRD